MDYVNTCKRIIVKLKKLDTQAEMEVQVERIAREEGLVGAFMRLSDDAAEELVRDALLEKV